MLKQIRYANWTSEVKESEIRRLLRFKPKYYLAGGLPGNQPLAVMRKILTEIIEDIPLSKIGQSALLNYGPSEGIEGLREIIANRLRREGIHVSGDEVTITTGSQQTLYGILKVMINPGDYIMISQPCYLGFLGSTQVHRARCIIVESDEYGIIPSSLEEIADQWHPKLLYVQTYSENPTGISLADDRKYKIYQIARQKGFYIIEDVAYKEIQEVPGHHPIKRHDTDNEVVIYLGTTSKEAAVLRIGYSVIPEIIRGKFIALKGYLDLCTPTLTQEIAKRYYEDYIEEVLPQINKRYNEQRASMKAAIDTYLTGSRSDPRGGFFIFYSQLGINTLELIEEALRHDVLYVPGNSFYLKGTKFHDARLSFSSLPASSMDQAIQRLAKVF